MSLARPAWRSVLVWAVVVAALSQAPNWLARARVPPGAAFIGSLAPWSEDVTYHLSFVEQARRGAFLFEDKYNGDRVGTRLILNTYFLLIGHTARLARLELADAALVARFATAVFLLLSAYGFAARMILGRTERVLFMVLAPFGSGLGWLPAWGVTRPFASLDQWAVEVSTFRGIADDMIAPVTTALLLSTLALVDRALARPQRRRALAAGALALLLGTVHPHDLLVTVYAVSAIVALLRAAAPGPTPAAGSALPQRLFDAAPLRALLWIVAVSSPILVYDAYVLWQEPLFWNYVMLDDAFRPQTVAAGFGVPLALAIPGALLALRREPARFTLLATWLGTVAILLFVPVPPCRQYFLLHGMQIGLSVLAAILLAGLWRHARTLGRGRAFAVRGALAALLVGSCLSSVGQVQQWGALLQRGAPDRFLPSDILQALRWLERHAAPSNTLLAAEAASRLAPAFAGVRVLAAQEQQTVDYAHWKEVVAALLSERDAGTLATSLERHGIDFVLVGPEEERIGGPGLRRRLDAAERLIRVFASGGVALYALRRRPSDERPEDAPARSYSGATMRKTLALSSGRRENAYGSKPWKFE